MDYSMDAWRYQYVTTADKAEGCLFCQKRDTGDDRRALIVHRAQHCFVILNLILIPRGT